MVKKAVLGIALGALIGVFTTSFFMTPSKSIIELFLTKITATSIITGLLCGVYAYLSKSKLQTFLVSILIGMFVFLLKYFITGHNFDPLTMGAFTGALIGAIFAVVRKIETSIKVKQRLERHRQSGFNSENY